MVSSGRQSFGSIQPFDWRTSRTLPTWKKFFFTRLGATRGLKLYICSSRSSRHSSCRRLASWVGSLALVGKRSKVCSSSSAESEATKSKKRFRTFCNTLAIATLDGSDRAIATLLVTNANSDRARTMVHDVNSVSSYAPKTQCNLNRSSLASSRLRRRLKCWWWI